MRRATCAVKFIAFIGLTGEAHGKTAYQPSLPVTSQSGFPSRQSAAARETAPLVQEESRAEGKGKPLRDSGGEAAPKLWQGRESSLLQGLHSSPLSFSVSQQQPRHGGDPGGVVTSSLFISPLIHWALGDKKE